jgi:ribonuclease P protein component
VLVLVGRHCRPDAGRIGLTVPKKVGKAHVRNLIKRRLRHLLRTDKARWRDRDLVIIVREKAADASFADLGAALDVAFERFEKALKENPPRRKKRRGGGRGGRGKKPAPEQKS